MKRERPILASLWESMKPSKAEKQASGLQHQSELFHDNQRQMRRKWAKLWQFLRRLHPKRIIPFVLGALVTVCAALSVFVLFPTEQIPVRYFPPIIYADLALLLMLAFLVMRRFVGAWQEIRRGFAVSKLYVRMMMLFGFVALLPTLTIVIASVIFFDLGLKAWFSENVRNALAESKLIAESYLEEHRKSVRLDTFRIARTLDAQAERIQDSRILLENVLDEEARLRGITEAIIFNARGEIFARSGITLMLESEPIPFEAIDSARKGEIVVVAPENADRVRAIVRLDNFFDAFLYAGRLVDAQVLAHRYQVREAVSNFESLEKNRTGIEISFALIFGVAALMMLFAVSWVGLAMASRFTKPLGQFVRATRKIGSGDYSAKIELKKIDEAWSWLAHSFNAMTGRLSRNRRQLLSAYETLDARHRFIETVLIGVRAGVVGLDTQGRITLFNPAAATLLGTELRRGVMLPEIVPEFSTHFERARARKIPFIETEMHRTDSQGRKRDLLVRIAAETESAIFKTGHRAGYVVTFDDITLLLRARMAATWSDFARQLVHEIRNPLTPIQLATERMQRKYKAHIPPEHATEFEHLTTIIARQVANVDRMAGNFAQFARLPEPNLVETDLGALCAEAVMLQSNHCPPNIAFETLLPDSRIMINCDPQLINQALINLLQNAMQSLAESPSAGAHGGESPADAVGRGRRFGQTVGSR